MSIKTRLVIIILSLIAIPAIFVSFIAFSNYKQSLTASRLLHLQSMTRFKVEKIDNYTGEIRNTLEISQGVFNIRKNLPILSRPRSALHDPEADSAGKILDRQLVRMQNILGLSNIMLADRNGRIVYVSNPSHSTPVLSRFLGEISPETFDKGTKGIFFSDAFMNKIAGDRPEMLAAAPISDLDGAAAGTIIFEIDLDSLFGLVRDTVGLGVTGEVLLGKKSGGDIVYLNRLRHDASPVLMKRVRIGGKIALPIQKAIASQTGTGLSIDYRGKNVAAAWQHISSLDWGLVAKVDAREIFAIVTNLQRLLSLVLVIIFILAAIITFSIAQSISVPIQTLTRGAEIIGGGNLDYRVGMNLNDEIGRLSRSFDKMTRDLKETTASRDELDREIAGRKAAERERENSIEFLQLVNDSKGLDGLIRSAVSFFKEKSGFEAVGIRLKKGGDYPYFETKGLSAAFVLAETHLCSRDSEGRPGRDARGYPIMECMCGNVIQGRSDPSRSFFTKRGNFWSNGTTGLLATSTEADLLARTRNRCNGEGYESVGLFALRAGGETLGLLQLNDKRKGMFSPSSLAQWERLSDYLAVAVSKFLTEGALRESEAGLKRAQEISHLGSWEIDLHDNRLTWSDEVYRIFGLAPQEFSATYEAFLEAVHPDDRAAVNEAYTGSIRDGKDMYEIEHRVVRKNSGEVRHVHEKCEHFRDESGKIVRSAGMVQDITERKKAEEGLRLRTEELKASNEELMFFNRAMTDREERMIELKKQVNELCAKLGERPRYDVDFGEEQ